VSETVADAGLVPVRVVGWHGPAWADPAALEALGRGLRGRHRTTLLSPFDSLVWFGARTKRIFGFARRLEAYVPRAQRVHGYFAMPLLAGGRIVGRGDPAREGRTPVARQVALARPARPPRAAAPPDAAGAGGGRRRAGRGPRPPSEARAGRPPSGHPRPHATARLGRHGLRGLAQRHRRLGRRDPEAEALFQVQAHGGLVVRVVADREVLSGL